MRENVFGHKAGGGTFPLWYVCVDYKISLYNISV